MKEDINYFIRSNEKERFYLSMTGISYCDGSYRIERPQSKVTVIEYIIKGTGTVWVEGKPQSVSKGDVYILEEGTDHLYYSDSKDPWTKIFFNIEGELVEKLFKVYEISSQMVIKECPAYTLFEKFRKIALGGLPKEVIFEQCSLVFHELIIYINDFVKKQPSLPETAVKMQHYLDSNIGKNIRIEELAALINHSPDYTIRLFKKTYNQTPYNYFLKKKLEVAKNLLLNTRLPIKVIARQIGFEDQHYFSNIFKKHIGLSPISYRKKVEGGMNMTSSLLIKDQEDKL